MQPEQSIKVSLKSKNQFTYLLLCLSALAYLLSPMTIQASTSPLSAEAIEKAVQRALIIDDGIPAYLIDVELDQGVVSLTGIVPHLGAKERATSVAETIKGVQSIVNRIKVSPYPYNRSDHTVKEDILESLQEDPATDSLELTVTVENGKAALFGVVPSLGAKELARAITAGIWGIQSVENNLIIIPKFTRDDQEIKEEIIGQLENNVWINAHPIRVYVHEGEVTLKGIVGSLNEKRRVRRIAMTNSVTQVNDDELFIKKWAQGEVRRTTNLGHKSDKEIKEILTSAFKIDPRISLGQISLDVQDGVVTLQGKVPHLKIKQEAEKVAKHTRGVIWVENFVNVRPTRALSDEAIKQKVKKAISRNAYVNSRNITPSILNGKVYLTGTAHSNFEKESATKAVADLKGILEIENHIVVTDTWQWKPDKLIQKDVKDELWWSPFIDSEEITMQVKNGIVTLQGTVDSWWEQEMAVRNAYEGGAKFVENHLIIQ